MINNRMTAIINEISQLREMDDVDMTLEAVEPPGAVKLTLVGVTSAGRRKTAERVIMPDESLDFLTDTFFYPNTITPNSKDIASKGVKMAYFDNYGDLIVERAEGTDKFMVKDKHRPEVVKKLKANLGNKFKN